VCATCHHSSSGSPNYGLWAKCGPTSHFIRPQNTFCQWWKGNIYEISLILYNVTYLKTITLRKMSGLRTAVQQLVSVACRGPVMPEATAWLDAHFPNFSIEQWSMTVSVSGYTLFVTSQYDVIFTLANQRFGEVFWHDMHIQGSRRTCRAGGAVKELKAMETYKRIATDYICFCSSTLLTSKIITEIIENHSEFSGCPNSCNKCVSSRSWGTM